MKSENIFCFLHATNYFFFLYPFNLDPRPSSFCISVEKPFRRMSISIAPKDKKPWGRGCRSCYVKSTSFSFGLTSVLCASLTFNERGRKHPNSWTAITSEDYVVIKRFRSCPGSPEPDYLLTERRRSFQKRASSLRVKLTYINILTRQHRKQNLKKLKAELQYICMLLPDFIAKKCRKNFTCAKEKISLQPRFQGVLSLFIGLAIGYQKET